MRTEDYSLVMRAGAVVLGLAGIIAVHVLDLPGKLDETPYLGVAYIALIVAAGALLVRILLSPSRAAFLASAGLAAAVLAGFVVNRTVGMPGAADDIGNWFEPLGLLSLVVEVAVIAAALWAARAVATDAPAPSVERAPAPVG